VPLIAPYSYDVLWQAANLRDLADELDELVRRGAHLQTAVPPREIIEVEGGLGVCLSMPAVSAQHGLYINKVATIFERPDEDPRPRIHALVTAFSTRTGEMLALLDGAAVTNIKCAAVSALVTRYCAADNAEVLAVIGAGVQARQQVHAVCAVRPIREIRLYARNPARLRAFAGEVQAEFGDRVKVVVTSSVDEAVSNADVIGTATASSDPVGRFAHLSPTVHINCMGGHTLTSRELPREVLESALLIVEDVETAVTEAGEYHRDALGLDTLVSRAPSDLKSRATVFSSTGHAFLDLATVAYLLRVVR
jgi:ornithine cyclodeaminase/alanine dehydrogenase-like protein (mu-crystallin family)